MHIDVTTLSPQDAYSRLIQTIVPRPIAWVLTSNQGGSHNLAPFSFFNAVCSDPPLVMLSVGIKPDGSEKDTWVNIRDRTHFVIHIAHRQVIRSVAESAASLPAGQSEIDALGLETTSFPGSPLPRLADCRVAFACERYDIRELGPGRQALILGKVTGMFVDDAVLGPSDAGKFRVSAEKLEPVGRLGGNEYVTFGEKLNIPRPP
jgi:flavin reductase (DIM6/NTAB) family NADH-FMN oxidoreductase RutF